MLTLIVQSELPGKYKSAMIKNCMSLHISRITHYWFQWINNFAEWNEVRDEMRSDCKWMFYAAYIIYTST